MPPPVKCAQETAEIAIAKERFPTRRRPQAGHHLIDDPDRSIAPARKPDRVKAWIIGDIQQRCRSKGVRTSEMPLPSEALPAPAPLRARPSGKREQQHQS
jgi:hypothetical protein